MGAHGKQRTPETVRQRALGKQKRNASQRKRLNGARRAAVLPFGSPRLLPKSRKAMSFPEHAPPPHGLVLVADNDTDAAEAIRCALREGGYDVVVVDSEIDLIAELHGLEFDVAIVSTAVSRAGNAGFVRTAKQMSPETEVIVTTLQADVGTAVACLREGAFDFFEKPLNLDALVRAVSRAIERRTFRTTAALYRACSDACGTASAARLPAVLVDVAVGALEADEVLLLVPVAKGAYRVLHAAGQPMSRVDHRVSIVAQALGHGTTAVILSCDPAGPAGSILGSAPSDVRSTVIYPLVASDRLVGVLMANRTLDPRPFRRGDLERAGVVASPVLLALENDRLLTRLLTSERLATVGQIAAGVAHEINNPLSYVMASHTQLFDQLIEIERMGAALPSEIDRRRLDGVLASTLAAIEDARDGATRIRDIARDLQAMSRGSGLSTEVSDVGEAARAALRICAWRVRETATVTTSFAPQTRVRASAGRLCQVFVNLIINAAQAAEGASRRVEIDISTRRENGWVVAHVRDTGPGIRPEHLEHLFDWFFSTKERESGSGIGLALSRQILEEVGGAIDVESRIGQGTTFTLRFPALALTREDARADLCSVHPPAEAFRY